MTLIKNIFFSFELMGLDFELDLTTSLEFGSKRYLCGSPSLSHLKMYFYMFYYWMFFFVRFFMLEVSEGKAKFWLYWMF